MTQNIFLNLPDATKAEVFESIYADDQTKIERIVSQGQATPKGQWLSSEKDEWVALLKGSACLKFEDDDADYVLTPGDYVNIKANRKHRVEWTDAKEPTVWLAVHYLSYNVFD